MYSLPASFLFIYWKLLCIIYISSIKLKFLNPSSLKQWWKQSSHTHLKHSILLYWTDFTNWSNTLLPLTPLFSCSWISKTAVGEKIPESFQTSANFPQNHFKDGIKVKFASGEMKSFQSCSRLFTQHNWIRAGEEVRSLGSEENRTWKQAQPPGGSVCTVKASEEGAANTIHIHTHVYQCRLGCIIRLHNPAKTFFFHKQSIPAHISCLSYFLLILYNDCLLYLEKQVWLLNWERSSQQSRRARVSRIYLHIYKFFI